jgi:hypothetical protein
MKGFIIGLIAFNFLAILNAETTTPATVEVAPAVEEQAPIPVQTKIQKAARARRDRLAKEAKEKEEALKGGKKTNVAPAIVPPAPVKK